MALFFEGFEKGQDENEGKKGRFRICTPLDVSIVFAEAEDGEMRREGLPGETVRHTPSSPQKCPLSLRFLCASRPFFPS